MSDQSTESSAHIVFFGMHIELYQWIAFFAGAQTVRVALEMFLCGMIEAKGDSYNLFFFGQVRLAWEAWMSFRAKAPSKN
jgi:hypothetical protein